MGFNAEAQRRNGGFLLIMGLACVLGVGLSKSYISRLGYQGLHIKIEAFRDGKS